MADAVLSEKEKRVLDRFQKHGVDRVNADYASFGSENTAFNVQSPIIYQIRGTNSMLVFGEIRKSMSLEEIKKWLSKHQEERLNKEHGHGDECAHEGQEHSHDEAVANEVAGEQPEDEAEDVDPRIKEDDVQLIMEQVKMPREDVIEALKDADYDVVNALVNLSRSK